METTKNNIIIALCIVEKRGKVTTHHTEHIADKAIATLIRQQYISGLKEVLRTIINADEEAPVKDTTIVKTDGASFFDFEKMMLESYKEKPIPTQLTLFRLNNVPVRRSGNYLFDFRVELDMDEKPGRIFTIKYYEEFEMEVVTASLGNSTQTILKIWTTDENLVLCNFVDNTITVLDINTLEERLSVEFEQDPEPINPMLKYRIIHSESPHSVIDYAYLDGMISCAAVYTKSKDRKDVINIGTNMMDDGDYDTYSYIQCPFHIMKTTHGFLIRDVPFGVDFEVWRSAEKNKVEFNIVC